MTAPTRLPCTAPLYDTWRRWKYAGSWTWVPAPPTIVQGVGMMNAWSARFIHTVFEALGTAARARSARLDGAPGETLGVPVLENPMVTEIADTIEAQRQVVQTLDIELDLRVWYRATPGAPAALAWLERGAMLWVSLGDAPSIALTVDHTLFIDGKLTGDSNRDLFLMNQPILVGMIAALSSCFGPVAEFEGLPSVTAAGYEPDAGEQ